MDISFSGAGFMGCYYFGVVDLWRRYIPRERVNRVAGTSAGSLIAAEYVLNQESLSPALREIVKLLESFRSRPLGVFDRRNGQIVHLLPEILDRVFPDDAHKRCSGKLYVCMTRFKDMKKVIVSEFETKKDLIDALNCSSFIPLWSGNHLPTYKGVKHMDGGFRDNLPTFDENTIRICCFSGASDISPYDRTQFDLLSATINNMPVNANFANLSRFKKALSPPTPNDVLELLELGFHDAKNFVLDNDLIQCDKCFSKMNNLKDHPLFANTSPNKVPPTLTPSVSPAISRRGSFCSQKSSSNSISNSNRNEQKNMQNIISNKLNMLHQQQHTKVIQTKNKPLSSSYSTSSSLEHSPSSCSSSSLLQVVDGATNDENNNFTFRPTTPVIVVEDFADIVATDITCSSSPASSSAASSPDHGAMEQEEQQVGFKQQEEKFNSKLQNSILKERFMLAPNPLPSCPPSPNLNRHCTECLRLRQQARLDTLEEELASVPSEFLGEKNKKRSKIRRRMSPIKWIKHLSTKSSYNISGDICGR